MPAIVSGVSVVVFSVLCLVFVSVFMYAIQGVGDCLLMLFDF